MVQSILKRNSFCCKHFECCTKNFTREHCSRWHAVFKEQYGKRFPSFYSCSPIYFSVALVFLVNIICHVWYTDRHVLSVLSFQSTNFCLFHSDTTTSLQWLAVWNDDNFLLAFLLPSRRRTICRRSSVQIVMFTNKCAAYNSFGKMHHIRNHEHYRCPPSLFFDFSLQFGVKFLEMVNIWHWSKPGEVTIFSNFATDQA